MKPKKLTHREQFEQTTLGHNAARAPMEFASPEQMIRHDAARTPVPPAIARRLEESIATLPPRQPWWKRLFQG